MRMLWIVLDGGNKLETLGNSHKDRHWVGEGFLIAAHSSCHGQKVIKEADVIALSAAAAF